MLKRLAKILLGLPYWLSSVVERRAGEGAGFAAGFLLILAATVPIAFIGFWLWGDTGGSLGIAAGCMLLGTWCVFGGYTN